jgi:hypothetical protein
VAVVDSGSGRQWRDGSGGRSWVAVTEGGCGEMGGSGKRYGGGWVAVEVAGIGWVAVMTVAVAGRQ